MPIERVTQVGKERLTTPYWSAYRSFLGQAKFGSLLALNIMLVWMLLCGSFKTNG